MGTSLTVREIIEELKKYDPEAEIYILEEDAVYFAPITRFWSADGGKTVYAETN